MRTFIKTIATLSILFLFVACNRDDSGTNSNNPSATAGFSWKENDPNSTTIKTAGSSEVRTQYKSIFAFSGTTATSGTLFEINLTGVSPATYDLAASGNAFYHSGFGNGGTITGKVVITKNDGAKASGTFEAFTTATGSLTKVYGTFTDIPVK